MPWLAIARYELRTLLGGWLVWLWLAGTLLVTLVLMLPNWQQMPTATLMAMLLFPYLVFPWFLVVMVLGLDPVSGARVEALRDGILSRPITRYQYLLSAWAARVVVVLGVYVVVMAPALALLGLAHRHAPKDAVTLYGILAALCVVGLVLVLQVSLGFLFGTLLRRPLPAIVVLLFLWYPMNLILHTFALEEFSPISLSQALPALLRQPWSGRNVEAQEVELDIDAMTRQTAEFLSVFGDQSERPPRQPGFFERANRDEFSLLRVTLGYGLPTLVAVGLAAICFCRRDL
jgi:ABC-type transport system involved in multi-copper enzyme maturation permease subunit